MLADWPFGHGLIHIEDLMHTYVHMYASESDGKIRVSSNGKGTRNRIVVLSSVPRDGEV